MLYFCASYRMPRSVHQKLMQMHASLNVLQGLCHRQRQVCCHVFPMSPLVILKACWARYAPNADAVPRFNRNARWLKSQSWKWR